MSKRRRLLVEGSDDQHVFWGLLKNNNFPETFVVEEKGGVDNLLRAFPVQAKGSEIEALGIVLDADLNIADRWNSVKDALVKLGYRPPDEFPSDGLVLSADRMPRVGAWIMPDNSVPGMLEDFVAFLVPDDDKLWAHALKTLEQMPVGLAAFSERHLSKARIHTWLAWQEDPGTPMGLAITKKYLDAGSPTVSPFLAWLRRLFVD